MGISEFKTFKDFYNYISSLPTRPNGDYVFYDEVYHHAITLPFLKAEILKIDTSQFEYYENNFHTIQQDILLALKNSNVPF